MKKALLLYWLALMMLVLPLCGCALFQTAATQVVASTAKINSPRDAMKSLVDAICPEPVAPDPRGAFASGFFDRYMANRQATELSQQDVQDITFFKVLCAKPIANRTDYDYGFVAGAGVDRIMVMLTPYMGRDLLSIVNLLPGVLR